MNAAILSARVTLLGASSGQAVAFDSSRLTNLTRTPMEIRELIVTAIEAQVGNAGLAAPSGVVNIHGKFGRHHITDGEVSLGVIAPAYLWELDDILNVPLMASYMTMEGHQTQMRWRFRRPLILPPGMGFTFEARFDASDVALITGATMHNTIVTVTAVGRYLTKDAAIPKVQSVPYISDARLRTNNVAGSGGDKTILSLQDDLWNANSSPFEVQRIVGARFFVRSAGGGAYRYIPVSAQTTGYASASDFEKLLFQLRFPDRTTLAGARVPLHSIFGQRGAIEGEFAIPPSGRCVAELFSFQRDYSAANVTDEIVKLGLVGDRLEVTQ